MAHAPAMLAAVEDPVAGDKRKAPPASSSTVAAEAAAASSGSNKRAAPTRVSWEDRVVQLKAYKAEFGDLAIPIRFKRNPSLGKFVHNTREQYKLFHNKTKAGYKKKCSLTQERIDVLNEIGFLWTTERSKRQNEDWNNRLEQLKEYKKKHGVSEVGCCVLWLSCCLFICCAFFFTHPPFISLHHHLLSSFNQQDCLVPHGYEPDPSFAEWIHRQRTSYAAMKKDKAPSAILLERMQKLEDLDFNFTVHTDKWMDHYNQLKEYKETHGDCQVPTHYATNRQLGRWTHTQRHQRRLQTKGKRSCMTVERINLLDQLGFSWEVRPAFDRPRATWQQRYDELRAYHLENGHFLVDADQEPLLHSWAHEQRTRLKNIATKGGDSSGRMKTDRQEALARIGFTKDVDLIDIHTASTASAVAPKQEEPALQLPTLLPVIAKPAPMEDETVDSVAAKLILPVPEVMAEEGPVPPEIRALAEQVAAANDADETAMV